MFHSGNVLGETGKAGVTVEQIADKLLMIYFDGNGIKSGLPQLTNKFARITTPQTHTHTHLTEWPSSVNEKQKPMHTSRSRRRPANLIGRRSVNIMVISFSERWRSRVAICEV